MDVAVGVSNIALVPMAAVPALQGISGIIKSISPEYRLQKWAIRIEQIVTAVTAKSDIIPSEVMSYFLAFVENYIKARCKYEEQIRRGKARWFWNKGAKIAHSAHARYAWNQGIQLSLHADVMHQKCLLEHKNRNPEGKCLVCFPDNYIANRYGSQISDTEAPLTWEFLLKSALNLSTHVTDRVNGSNVVSQTIADPIQPQAVEPITSHRPPSYHAPVSASRASAGQNYSTSDAKTLGHDDVPELSIPLDEEESRIVGAVVRRGLSSLIGVGCEGAALEPEAHDVALQSDDELGGERNTSDEIELVSMTG